MWIEIRTLDGEDRRSLRFSSPQEAADAMRQAKGDLVYAIDQGGTVLNLADLDERGRLAARSGERPLPGANVGRGLTTAG